MSGKRWNPNDDEMLLAYHDAAGANFIASHDLGRPHGAGARRLRQLDKSGATLAYIDRELMHVDFMRRAGYWDDDEARYYREELQRQRNAATLRAVK